MQAPISILFLFGGQPIITRLCRVDDRNPHEEFRGWFIVQLKTILYVFVVTKLYMLKDSSMAN